MIGTVSTQLSAFQNIAVALQHAHGRKTVIWLTGWFPVDVNEANDGLNIGTRVYDTAARSVSIDYQRTIDLLNDAQISIFPVQMKAPSPASTLPGISLSELNQEATINATETGLRRIARSTGGELMAPSEILQNIVQHAEDRSTSYYLLKFQPEPIKDALRWRSLKIELQDKSLKAKSPDGLFLFNSK